MTILGKIGAWMEDQGWYADGLHFLGGLSAILATVTLWGHLWIFVSAMIVYAAFKEFYFDIHFEAVIPQTYLKGLRDFAGYMAGTILAVIIELWAKK